VVNLSKELSGEIEKNITIRGYKFSPVRFNGEEKGGRL
jgi:hypothetical protein